MASLTHVCMWSGNGWKRVTAEKATRMHPGGTVSASSGLFMCELCGQYVSLIDGDIQVRHFRHSSKEKSKNCPERTFGGFYGITYESTQHDLPIRIRIESASSFSLEIGLIRVPMELLGRDFCIKIESRGSKRESFIFKRERINPNGVTYLPIGAPCEEYSLTWKGAKAGIQVFWPQKTRGISAEGAVFDAATGRILPNDADVEIGKEYYILTAYYCIDNYRSVELKEIARQTFSFRCWRVYSVIANDFSEEAAKFFLEYHCRLTERPVSMQMVWPLYTKGSYVLTYNEVSAVFLIRGDAASVNAFPMANIRKLSSNPVVKEVYCQQRQQLISAGRTNALQYMYLWKEPLGKAQEPPIIQVKDIHDNYIEKGEHNDELPPKEIILIELPYDGEVIVYSGNYISDRRKIAAAAITELDGIGWNTKVKIYVGLDCLYEVEYKKKSAAPFLEEDKLYKYISLGGRTQISTPPGLKNIALAMKKYPRIVKWIEECIKRRTIDKEAYRKLQRLYIELKQTAIGG